MATGTTSKVVTTDELNESIEGRLKSDAVSANASYSFAMRRGIVYAFRASATSNPCIWLIDQWSGATPVHENGSLATIAVSNNTVTVTNKSSAYITVAAIDFGF